MGEIERTLIWGAGAMGALYAEKLHEYGSNAVSLLAEGECFEKLVKNGLTVNGRNFHPDVVRPEEIAEPFDLVIVALKHHHLIADLWQLKKAVGGSTLIMSVMNGVDSEEILGDAYGRDKTILTVALGMDALRENGRVTYANEGRLLFGEMEREEPGEKVERVRRLFEKANIVHEVRRDMVRPLWWKMMINVGVNQASAVLGAPFGVFQRSGNARALMEKAMMEVVAVAEALDVGLTEKDIEEWNPILEKLSPTGKTSMLQDVEAGRKTEVEIFAGKILELGKKLDVPTPVNDVLFRIIGTFEEMASARKIQCGNSRH
jgi:2-dehydropantoate 2-reductase